MEKHTQTCWGYSQTQEGEVALAATCKSHFSPNWQFNNTMALCLSGAGAIHRMVFEVPQQLQQLPAKLRENA